MAHREYQTDSRTDMAAKENTTMEENRQQNQTYSTCLNGIDNIYYCLFCFGFGPTKAENNNFNLQTQLRSEASTSTLADNTGDLRSVFKIEAHV